MVAHEVDVEAHGIGLAEAIAVLRNELLAARAEAAGADIQIPVESMTVALHVAATRSRDGKAGFRVPFVNAELGASAGWQREHMQTVTVVFGPPVDRDGNPVKVARASAKRKG
ncbi:MAG: trypco2 family protein [Acidimicrobiales bacterium]